MKTTRCLCTLGLILQFSTSQLHATLLDSWHWRNPSPFANSLRSICYGDGKFVAVGDRGVIHTSLDGVSWDEGQRPVTSWLYKVIFTNGQFVAVGEGGVIMTSPDGYSWTNRVSGTTNALFSVAYGNGKYVACGQGGQLAVSTDGSSWQPATVGTNDLNWIAIGNGVFILPEPSQQFLSSVWNQQLALLVSSDAQSWTRVPFPEPYPIQYQIGIVQVEFGNGVFVAIVQDELHLSSSWLPCDHFYQSVDGTNWVQGAQAPGPAGYWQHHFLTFSGDFFYEFASQQNNPPNNLNVISRAFNGISCDSISAPTDAANATSLAYGNGKYVLTALNGLLWTSPDAVNWTSIYGGLRTGIYQFLRAGDGYLVLAGSQLLMTSDGINFISTGNSPTNIFSAVAYDSTNYVAVGVSGNLISGFTGEVYTSTDSINWIRRTSNTTKALAAICRGPTRWVAVGASGTIISSPNTLAWTLRSSGTANNLNWVAFGNNSYVAVGNGRTIVTSPDGGTWDVQYSGTTANLTRVRFLNGQFFAVGGNGILLSSPDGSTWTNLASGTTQQLNDVTYGNGCYLACGNDYDQRFHSDSPYINVVTESTNGIDWTDITRKVPVHVGLNSVAFLDGSFWLCGNNGALLQSDTADGLPHLAGTLLPGNSGYQLKILLNIPPAYRIQVSTNLAPNSWRDALTNSAPSSIWTDTNAFTSPFRFFRIISP